jgi:hypothetical protein
MAGARVRHRGAELRRWWGSLRFRQLLILIVVAMLLTPLRLSHGLLALVFQFIILNTLVVALSAVHGRQRALRTLVLGLWGAGTVLKVLDITGVAASDAQTVATAALDAVLMAASALVVLRYVVSGSRVDTERIFAALVAYFLLAMVFASLFALVEVVEPGSFRFAGGASNASPVALHDDFLYFSIVTITTVGYGDIMPVLPLAKMLSAMEAIAGQFYIAVVVAWLVTAYASRRNA